MTRNYIAVGAATGALLLAGCSGQELGSARMIEPAGSEFSQNLYRGYISLAADETAEGDYRDSDKFAIRAKQAGRGGAVPPEAIAARNLPANKIGELTEARAGLVTALERGAADRDPARAANAQIMFDCWMQEQEENFQPEDIARCRSGHLAAMDALAPSNAASTAPPAPSPIKFVVYFATDRFELDNAALAVTREAKLAAAKVGGRIVKVSGNADSVGDSDYNQALSKMRADAVAKVLATPDMPVETVVTEAHGELQPAVWRANGVAEPMNRRVEIIIQP